MIQQGLFTPKQTRRYALVLLTAGSVAGLALVYVAGLPLLWIGAAGVLSGYLYSSPPLAFNYRGWGELLVGLNFGILAVAGSYYVQTGTHSLAALVVSLPLALLVTAILLINEFPDHTYDAQAGKTTLVVRFGVGPARTVFLAIVTGPYIIAALAVLSRLLPAAAA